MRTAHSRLICLTLAAGLLCRASHAFAQTPDPQLSSRLPSATLEAVWKRVSQENAAARALTAATGPEARQAEYENLLRAFLAAREFQTIASDEPLSLTTRAIRDVRREGLTAVIEHTPESATATSTTAALTNSSSNQLVERSGLTNLVSVASDFKKLFSSDDNAVSLSLNAIALLGGAASDTGSAPDRYARHEAWRRLGGTVTFGGKIPEKEITGLSGLPSAETLFDAFSWDVKLRLVGDRDSRASRWSRPLLRLGDTVELITRAQGLPEIPPDDAGVFLAASNVVLGERAKAVTDPIATSLQISVKVAGVHLTNVSGKNKYTFATMLDKGFGGLDLTLNASYNVADSTNEVTGVYSARDFQMAAGLTGTVLNDVLVPGRGAELTASFKGQLVNDGANATADRRSTFNINATLTLPFQDKGKIPVSITWTNDPNNLTKQKYIRGQIGLSYDFGSIFGLLKH